MSVISGLDTQTLMSGGYMPADSTANARSAGLATSGTGPAGSYKQGEQRERLLLNALPIGMLLTDRNGRCLDANPAALSLLELTYDLVVDRPISEHLPGAAELLIEGIPEHADGVDAGELRIRRPSGSEFIIELSVARIDCSQDPAIVYFFREISDEVALAEQLRETAMTDALTGLPNRDALEQQVDLALRNISRGGPEGVLCFIDLDNFKLVNDTCGHAAGDAMLRMVAETFRQRTRATDTIGRIGGDEFGVLLNGCQVEDAIAFIAKLRDKVINLDFTWDGKPLRIGLSAGLARLTPRTHSVAEALAEADKACFAAKSAGRCETRVFTDRVRAAGAALSADADIAHQLRDALARDAVSLSVQSLRRLGTPTDLPPVSEILLRLTDASGQLIPPTALLPIASRFGLAQELDRWVVERLLRWLEAGQAQRRRRRFHVNITASSLVDDSFVSFLADQLTEQTAPSLGIEIPERDILLHPDAAAYTVRAVHALGCAVSIDRISGRADAIEPIARLPVDLLKLGPEFALMSSADDIAYVHAEAMVRIVKRLSLPVAVTGIETEQALRCATAIGADLAQGVAIAPAITLIPPA